MYVAFTAFGLFMLSLGFDEQLSFSDAVVLYLITGVYLLFGMMMLRKHYTTRYSLGRKALTATGKYLKEKKYVIPYPDIVEVDKRKINMLFKHGKFGRIRMETSSLVLWITFIERQGREERERVIMISPKDIDGFAGHLLFMINKNNTQ